MTPPVALRLRVLTFEQPETGRPAELDSRRGFAGAVVGATVPDMGVSRLWLVRHGESVANVAAAEAESGGLDVIDARFRDADVPLSSTGRLQADALGVWITESFTEARAPRIWASSYLRAQETIERALAAARIELPIGLDDRLRDRELGILDLLTSRGVQNRYPVEADRRRWLGKFYYRPPGGESWADVALRIRSFIDELDRDELAAPVLVATHDAVITLFAYVLLRMSEPELMQFAAGNVVSNASVTSFVRNPDGSWSLETFADARHLHDLNIPITEHPGEHHAES
jgi:broad specificity phosphatase PhoE